MKLDKPDIDLHIAINPTANSSEEFIVKLPDHPDNYCAKLNWKHRNSLGICLFLSHVKNFNNNTKQRNSLSDEDDEPIVNSCTPSNKKPVWITTSGTLSDEEILEGIRKEQSLPNDGSVTLLHDLDDDGQRKRTISTWCQTHKWNFVNAIYMYGRESLVIVMYDLYMNRMEFFSRAKSRLVIVTRQ